MNCIRKSKSIAMIVLLAFLFTLLPTSAWAGNMVDENHMYTGPDFGEYTLEHLANSFCMVSFGNINSGDHVVASVAAAGDVTISHWGGSSVWGHGFPVDKEDRTYVSKYNQPSFIKGACHSGLNGFDKTGVKLYLTSSLENVPSLPSDWEYGISSQYINFDQVKAALQEELGKQKTSNITNSKDIKVRSGQSITVDNMNITSVDFIGKDFSEETVITVLGKEVFIKNFLVNGLNSYFEWSGGGHTQQFGKNMKLTWYFPEAETVTFGSDSWAGHIVVPNGNLILTGGNTNGCLIANNITLDAAEAHFYAWNEGKPIPETVTGSLNITKQVKEKIAEEKLQNLDVTKDYSFTITPETKEITLPENITVNGVENAKAKVEVDSAKNVAIVTVPLGNIATNTVTVSGLPLGDYTVAEVTDNNAVNVDGYDFVKVTADDAEVDKAVVTIAKDTTASVAFTNVYEKTKPATGSLDITKHVEKQIGEKTEPLPVERGYNFTITPGKEITLPDTLTVNKGEVTVANNVATVTVPLKEAAGKVTVSGLPLGDYTVAEVTDNNVVNVDGYDFVKVIVDGAEADNTIVKIVKDTATTTAFTNVYKKSTGSLSITKHVKEKIGAAKEPQDFEVTKNYEFTITPEEEITLPNTLTVNSGSITVAGNKATVTVPLANAYEGTVTVSGLPLGEYTVTEVTDKDAVNVDRYEFVEVTADRDSVIVKKNADSIPMITFTNTYVNGEKISISGTKTWIAPEGTEYPNITINLLQDGEQYDKVVLENGKTDYSFKDLPKYDMTDGHEYVYTVAEDAVAGYTSTVDGYNITNTIAQDDSVKVSGTKTWIAPEGTEYPNITINLLQDGEQYDKVVLENGKTDYSFKDLPKYNLENGHEYVYTVTEDPVAGYTSEQQGNDFINTIAQDNSVEVSGTKTWIAPEGTEYPNITINLLQDGEQYDKVVLENGKTDYSFKNLPKYDMTDGHEYVYEVAEDAVAGYTSTVDGYNITNTAIDTLGGMINLTKQVQGNEDNAITKDYRFQLALTIDNENVQEPEREISSDKQTLLDQLTAKVDETQAAFNTAIQSFTDTCAEIVNSVVAPLSEEQMAPAPQDTTIVTDNAITENGTDVTDKDVTISDSTNTDEDVNTSDSTNTDEDVNTSDSTTTDEDVNTSDSTITDEDVNTSDSTTTDEDVNTSDSTITNEESNTSDSTTTDEDASTSDDTTSDEGSTTDSHETTDYSAQELSFAGRMLNTIGFKVVNGAGNVTAEEIVQRLAALLTQGVITDEEAVNELKLVLVLALNQEDLSDEEREEALAVVSDAMVEIQLEEDQTLYDAEALHELYEAAESVFAAYAAYTEAWDEYTVYYDSIFDREMVATPSAIQLVLNYSNGTSVTVELTKQTDGTYVYDGIVLRNGEGVAIDVDATTGSAINFTITETENGGAKHVDFKEGTLNHVGDSVSGNMASGDKVEYIAINTFDSEPVNPPVPDEPVNPPVPDEPVNPPVPDEPVNPPAGGGSDDRYDGPYSDGETTIPEQAVPLTEPDVEETTEEPVIEIEEPEVPLADMLGETTEPDETITIDDPEVPLGDAPRTGDNNNTMLFIVLMMLAAIGMVITRRKFN